MRTLGFFLLSILPAVAQPPITTPPQGVVGNPPPAAKAV